MKVKFCPKCKSSNIEKELNVLLAVGAPQKWICKECGYYGLMFPEINEKNINKIRREKIKNDTKKRKRRIK